MKGGTRKWYWKFIRDCGSEISPKGSRVVLANPEMEMMYGWEELGMESRVDARHDIDVCHTPFLSKTSTVFFPSWLIYTCPLDPTIMSNGR